jgi:hypothetical protein
MQLRNGVSPSAVTPQPWFEDLLPGRGTRYAASARSNDFIQGNLSDFGLFFLDNVLPGFASNGEVQDFLFRTNGARSNYHSANITLHKDFSSGLQLIAGYSFSKSLNDFDESQGWPLVVMDSYNLGANYGPSSVDGAAHVVGALALRTAFRPFAEVLESRWHPERNLRRMVYQRHWTDGKWDAPDGGVKLGGVWWRKRVR